MTNEEAIAELRDIFINALDYKDKRTEGAFSLAIDALEKQMPNAPINRTSWPFDCDGGNCPNCNREINQQFEYCPECGQRLEW